MTSLFEPRRYAPLASEADLARGHAEAKRAGRRDPVLRLDPTPDESLLEIYDYCVDPTDAGELLTLYLGRVEAMARDPLRAPAPEARLQAWKSARRRRRLSADDVLNSRATVSFVKELFNCYFRDELYGALRRDDTVVLSSGSVDEARFGLPDPLRDCIRFALDRDWYGYSDSRGRDASREAMARYESTCIDGVEYTRDNISFGMGGTVLIAAVADFVLTTSTSTSPALCAIPNYPPLVQSVARRVEVSLVPLAHEDSVVSLQHLIDALTPDTPLILLQTALNPTGAQVPDAEIGRLLNAAGPNTLLLLDECHEWLADRNGAQPRRSHVRGDPRVIRVSSLSKNWSAPGLKVGWLVGSKPFVDAFYEYSSTTFGGPASFFYTLTEVLARMERWFVEGIDEPGSAELAEFEPSYGLQPAGLCWAYRRYVDQRELRQRDLVDLRDASVGLLLGHGARVGDPTYSINMAVGVQPQQHDYVVFRDLLHDGHTSVFPGILTMMLSSDIVRVTTARPWADLDVGLRALGHEVGR